VFPLALGNNCRELPSIRADDWGQAPDSFFARGDPGNGIGATPSYSRFLLETRCIYAGSSSQWEGMLSS
jgi:hypothetical protein